MDRHCQNAARLAESLEQHDQLEAVRYPFLASHPQYNLAKKQMKQGGSIITFIIKGGYQLAARLWTA
jgi:O-succinylhomoserine sulfhydrylase